MTAPALDLALIEFGRAYSNLRRHFYARRAGHRIPGVTRAECDKCVRTPRPPAPTPPTSAASGPPPTPTPAPTAAPGT